MMRKKVHLGDTWGGGALGAPWLGVILAPPDYQFSKKTPHHRPQCTRTLSHALRAPAVADLNLFTKSRNI